MLRTQLWSGLLAGLLVTMTGAGPSFGAEESKGKFYEAYYLEHAEGDLAAAQTLYAAVARTG